MKTTTRISVAIDDHVHALAQGADLNALQRDIIAAVRNGGEFVVLKVAGAGEISVLFTSSTAVAFSLETVPFDTGDDWRHPSPFDGNDDYRDS